MLLQAPPGYRSDVFVRVSSGNNAINAAAIAACWGGPTAKAMELIRVWDGATGTKVQDQKSGDFRDLWAVPAAWGEPDTSQDCWKPIGDSGCVVNKVDVLSGNPHYRSTAIYPYVPPMKFGGGQVAPASKYGAGQPVTRAQVASPEVQAAHTRYAATLSASEIDAIVKTFGCANSDSACFATFVAGASCPNLVDQAQKAGVLAGVVRANKNPETFCAEVSAAVAKGPTTSSDVSGWVKVGIAAAVVSSVIGIVAFLERHKGPKKNPVAPRPRAGYALTAHHGESFFRIPNDDWDHEVMSAPELRGARYVGDRRIDGTWMNIWEIQHGDRYVAQTAFD